MSISVVPDKNESLHSAKDLTDLQSRDLYFNREMSLLAFNERVLAQSRDKKVPLLERLRFLCISCSNLDEFFEVRVAGIKKRLELGEVNLSRNRMAPSQLFDLLRENARELIQSQYDTLNNELLPALAKENIHFIRRDDWSKEQCAWIKHFFDTQVAPILSPVRLDPAHPFPKVLNKALHFIIELDGEDAFGQQAKFAVLQAPRVLPRFIRLPDHLTDNQDAFVFLSSVIHSHVDDLFPGLIIEGCYQFRVTRNSNLMVDEEEIEDLKAALEGELPSRQYGEAVRLEIADNCPEHIGEFLLNRFELEEGDLFRVNGPVNLHRLFSLPEAVHRPEHMYPGFVQGLPPGVNPLENDYFDLIGRNDMLLHHPFQSFSVVLDFVRQAASDPDVLAIKQTLYRTGSESELEDLLVMAARAGKEVTVCVELRARFDEEANISLADRLQEAGAHVVYGVVGYKTHAKMLMVVRREGETFKRYVHLGTGNYHAKTTRMYTDWGLLTCDTVICDDVHKMFMQLTSLGHAEKLGKLLQSPFTLYKSILDHIDIEIANSKLGKPARIIAKMNSLVEANVIQALYKASQAGVGIDLIVRGICCLRPGVPGVSENIRVRSIVGRFLEHTRVFYFENDGEPKVYGSSADWMPRNLHRRIEACFPIEDKQLKKQVIEQGLMLYLKDDCQAWELLPNGSYMQLANEIEPTSAQRTLLKELSELA